MEKQDENKCIFFSITKRISRALIGWFLSSIISGQTGTNKCPLRARVLFPLVLIAQRRDFLLFSLRFCYCKNQIDNRFLCACPLTDDKFRQHIVNVVCGSTRHEGKTSAHTLSPVFLLLYQNLRSILETWALFFQGVFINTLSSSHESIPENF